MKNKHVNVTPEMRDRLKAEMKRSKRINTNAKIAELLDLTTTQISRILTGRSSCALEYIERLAEEWEVRTDYLLCKDDYRTIWDIYEVMDDQLSKKNKAVLNLLDLYGYRFEIVELLKITSGDIARLKDANEELRFIKDYVKEENKENIEVEIKRPHRRSDNSSYRIFELTGGILKKYLWRSNVDPAKCKVIKVADHHAIKILPDDKGVYHEIIGYVDFWTKITLNGELIGYVKHIDDYLGVLSENTNTLFNSMLKADRFKMTDWKMIFDV